MQHHCLNTLHGSHFAGKGATASLSNLSRRLLQQALSTSTNITNTNTTNSTTTTTTSNTNTTSRRPADILPAGTAFRPSNTSLLGDNIIPDGCIGYNTESYGSHGCPFSSHPDYTINKGFQTFYLPPDVFVSYQICCLPAPLAMPACGAGALFSTRTAETSTGLYPQGTWTPPACSSAGGQCDGSEATAGAAAGVKYMAAIQFVPTFGRVNIMLATDGSWSPVLAVYKTWNFDSTAPLANLVAVTSPAAASQANCDTAIVKDGFQGVCVNVPVEVGAKYLAIATGVTANDAGRMATQLCQR